MKLRRIVFLVVIILSALVLIGTSVLAGERLSMGYTYGGSKSYIEIVEQTNGSINVVSPTCFNINMSGKLTEDVIMSQTFVDRMHEQGIKITPFLSNNWGQKRAQLVLKNPQNLINILVQKIEENNYDGVNVDLENLAPSDKDSLTNFVRLLREALPKEKTLSIAVAANPDKLTTTWVAAYDYKALAEYVDYLVLMAYDEHCYGGSEGPVASIGFVDRSLQVIFEEVPKDKVVLGIPLYGRYWKEYESFGGEAIVIGTVQKIIKKYKLVPKYDNETGTPYVILDIDDNEIGPMVNGKVLDPGRYHIYYENETSIKAKLKLVNKYNILGTALWALDNESPEFWNYFSDALNEVPYETEKEVTIRRNYEAAVKTFNEVVIKNEVYVKKLVTYEQENKVACTIEEEILRASNSSIEPEFKIKGLSEVIASLFNDKAKRQVKIKRYIIDENNKLKAAENKTYYTMNLVTVPRTRALVVV